MNRRSLHATGAIGLLLVMALVLQACSVPPTQTTTTRVVDEGIQVSEDRVMFFYSEDNYSYARYDHGLLECYVDSDGSLSDCRELNFVFEEGQ